MARLAKCWNSTIICPQELIGRSYIFELMGIKAGMIQESKEKNAKRKPSIWVAFWVFLEMVTVIGQQIIFLDDPEFYDIPDELLKQRPLLIDPSNPYINVMACFCGSQSVQRLFSHCAEESLKRFHRLERQVQTGSGFLQLKELFLPQLLPFLFSPPPIGPMMPQSWLIGVQSGACPLQPRLIVRNTALNKKTRSQIAKFLKAFSAFVSVCDIEFNYKFSGDRRICAKCSVEKTIDYLFGRSNWYPAQDRHCNYDVTAKIPIGAYGRDYLIISSNWFCSN